jgi:NACHT domain
MAQVADQLAVAVSTQWNDEVAVRRLNDPYPLPVSWDAADASLTDPWEVLVKQASSGAGRPVPPPAEPWASGPDDLVGKGEELVKVLARVPTGRLVVLGEPGAGKTMLMVRLVIDLLARRAEGSPVPFMAPLASWDPAAQDLRNWLAGRLRADHPALADPTPKGRTEPNQADALLASGLILPLLDGLDEIPEQARGAAISGIKDALRQGEQVVVTCRSKEYRDAVRPEGGAEVTLWAAAVQLRPLDAETVRSYLRDAAPGPAMKARWDPVLKLLGTEAPVGQALSTPLMVGLAQAIYNPRPGEAGTLPNPEELCKPDLADRTAVESRLLDAFITAAYRPDPADRWNLPEVKNWLRFLARHLEHTIKSPDLAWWQLPRATTPSWAVSYYRASSRWYLVFAALLLIGVEVTPRYGLRGRAIWETLVVGSVVVFIIVTRRRRSLAPVRRMLRGVRWQRPSRDNIRFGAMAGAIAGAYVGTAVGAVEGVVAGAVVGAGTAVVVGGVIWMGGQEGAPLDLTSAASPQAVLAADRRTGIAATAGSGVAFGLLAGLLVQLLVGVAAAAVAGVAAGIVFGIACGFELAAWPSYSNARIRLARRHKLPWRLMQFLADAHRRGVLRQVGAVYQFRHIELQHRLANRGTDKEEANSSAAPAAADDAIG